MIDLSKATFIIPVRIDSMDRAFNFQYVVNYLCRNLITNIRIFESGPAKIAEDLLKAINPIHCKIHYEYRDDGGAPFHRTLLLNEMLADSDTPVVVNYDADVVLKPETYLAAYNKILNEGVHLCYPYFQGNSQVMVFRPGLQDDLTISAPIRHEIRDADCGFVQFFSRSAYIQGGMEAEDFISYGPEDYERKDRFVKLGYKVEWLPGHYVYHIEHSRGADSTKENPHFQKNWELYEAEKRMSGAEIRDYYKSRPYLDKYKPKKIILVTYADDKYEEKRKRLTQKAMELGAVDACVNYSREDLVSSQFYKENKFILDQPRGAGYWLWKPYFILQTMKNEMVKDGDIIVYMDAGDMITRNFRAFLNKKLRNQDMLLLDGSYRHGDWTHRECFQLMGCDTPEYHEAIQLEAGVCVFKRSRMSIDVVYEWLLYCKNNNIISDNDNQQLHCFKQHRHDQSILTNIKVRRNLPSGSEIRQYITCNYTL